MFFDIERTEMSTVTVNPPVTTAAPRSAAVAATLFVAFLAKFKKLSERRKESRQVAGRQDEAARVRTFAHQIMAQDPRFAADLFAAADRHERF